MIRTLVVVVLLLVGATGQAATPGVTPEAEQQARRIFQNAEAHFRSGLFAEALAEYQAGYDTAPLPGFLINIAQCHRRLGDLNLARATYRKFIMIAPDSPFVPQVKELIAELDNLARDLERPTESTQAAQPEQVRDATPVPPLPAVRPSEASRPDLISEPAAPIETKPAKTRWWLWGVLGGAAVVAATTAVFVFRSPGTNTLHDGSLGTLRR